MYKAVVVALVCVVTTLGILLPHETDCDKYYMKTSRGRRIRWTCAFGKLFDYKSQTCKLPAYTQCTNLSSISPTTTPMPTSTVKATVEVSTVESFPTTAEELLPTTAEPPMYIDFLPNGCPEDPRFEILLANEIDCSSYYQCSYGRKVLKSCPKGMYFSYDWQVCVNAYEVECSVTQGWTTETEIKQTATEKQYKTESEGTTEESQPTVNTTRIEIEQTTTEMAQYSTEIIGTTKEFQPTVNTTRTEKEQSTSEMSRIKTVETVTSKWFDWQGDTDLNNYDYYYDN